MNFSKYKNLGDKKLIVVKLIYKLSFFVDMFGLFCCFSAYCICFFAIFYYLYIVNFYFEHVF